MRRKTLIKRTRRNTRKRIQLGGKASASPIVTVFMLCFNEERILDFTVNAYRRLFHHCKIVIYDNESTDKSVEKAKALDCEVRSYSTGNKLDEILMTKMRNTVWKDATTPWVIVCDMDEIITANQNDLIAEDKKGTNILKTYGYEMYGKSEKDDLSNIKVNSIINGQTSTGHSKTICFRADQIADINFSPGAHTSDPVAKDGYEVKFSEKEYPLYHFKKMGIPYYKSKQSKATPRAVEMKKFGLSVHYTANDKINENAVSINDKGGMEKVPPLSTYYLPSQ